jgi:hypothetical protein
MTKDYLLGIFRTQKNNYRLTYVLMVLTSQNDVMGEFLHLYKHIDPKFKFKVMDGVEPLILDKKVLQIAVDQFHMTVLRAIIKELFEVLKIYCKNTDQDHLLRSQAWYQLWRIIRNCLSHDFHFKFTDHDKKILPILWNGIEIREDMDGTQMNISHFSFENIWTLINEVETFIENELT